MLWFYDEIEYWCCDCVVVGVGDCVCVVEVVD